MTTLISKDIFKSKTFPDMYFVQKKYYLIACLILYIASIFLVDLGADHLTIVIREFLVEADDIQSSLPLFVKRFVVLDLFFGIGIIFSIIVIFKGMPMFCCFTGSKRFDDELLIYSFLRVLFILLFSSVILLIFFASAQGLLFLLPKVAVALYYYFIGLDPKLETRLDDISFIFFEKINISLAILFIIRIGIVATIIQGLLLTKNSKKTINVFLVKLVILPFMIFAIFCVKSTKYVAPPKKEPQFLEIFKTQPKKKPKEVIEDQKDTIRPTLKISIYDPNTDETISNTESF
jgi:hypothetical protein